MCSICRKNPCDCRCPNYTPLKTRYHCSICNDGIYDGEEYIENDIGEYAHWECVDYGKDLAKFLGYEIKTMEDECERNY